MGTTTQLDIYGGETAHVEITKAAAPLTPCQREILRLIQNLGSVTSSQAGRIVHAHRDGGCQRCRDVDRRCRFAASDGHDAMKRLTARGIVRRHHRGLWVMAS